MKEREGKEELQRLPENELSAAPGTERDEMVQVFPGLTESRNTPAWSSSNGFDISKQIWRCV